MAVVTYIKRRDTTGGSTTDVDTGTSDISLEREIYQKLASVTDNKVLVRPPIVRNEFDRWIIEMDDMAAGVTGQSQSFLDLDEYLGSLGLTKEYPFSQDRYDAEIFISAESIEPLRNVSTFTVDNIVEDNVTVNGTDNVVYITGA